MEIKAVTIGEQMSGNSVVFIDGVRTPFGRAREDGAFAYTRADDLVVACLRKLLHRFPNLPPEKLGDVAIAATTQSGDQGLNIGRSSALLAGLPESVPGYSVDRMCAGAMTAVTTLAGGINFGAYEIGLAGGVEHMGRHPMGQGVDPNPRFLAEKLVDADALVMGETAEKLHDNDALLTRERADAYALHSQQKYHTALRQGVFEKQIVPISTYAPERGWSLASADEQPRPETNAEKLATLPTPFRARGRVTAGNSAGLNDGATACLLASESIAAEKEWEPSMRLVSYAYSGVQPDVMGYGPIPSTQRALELAGLNISDIDIVEVNEPFAVQVLAFLQQFGIKDGDPRVNPYGGALAVGHPLAASGVRLMTQLAHFFSHNPHARYGVTALCVGLGMGGTVIWENCMWKGHSA